MTSLPVSEDKPRHEVVAGVLTRPDGCFLLAQRPPGKPYAGYWEFPGGKVAPGEKPDTAIRRELHEELGIKIEQAYPWIVRSFNYSHANVRLNFYRITKWRGKPSAQEGQQLAWQTAMGITVTPMLPANGAVLRALTLPAVYGITHASGWGPTAFLKRLALALDAGLKMVQVREKQLSDEDRLSFAKRVVEMGRRAGALVMVNGNHDLIRASGATGWHLCAGRMQRLHSRPDIAWCGASCHDKAELDKAMQLDLDYVLVSPVLPTLSHPDAQPMGWSAFAELIRSYPLPVYALGGMTPSLLQTAWHHGAHGIGMLRAAW
jgi:8-oxo-dGTP diphosphatase